MQTAGRLVAWLAVAALWAGSTASAQAPAPTAQPQVVARRAVGAAGRTALSTRVSSTTIFGYLWSADNTPIANATLRLRNVLSGRAEAMTTSDGGGEFTFTDVEGGTYVVEYVDGNGKVIAVGHTFSVAPGETVATFVRLGARLPWFSGLFSNAAAAAVSSAAGLGVTAVAPTGRQVTPSS